MVVHEIDMHELAQHHWSNDDNARQHAHEHAAQLPHACPTQLQLA